MIVVVILVGRRCRGLHRLKCAIQNVLEYHVDAVNSLLFLDCLYNSHVILESPRLSSLTMVVFPLEVAHQTV